MLISVVHGLFEFSFRDTGGFLIAFIPALIDLAIVAYISVFLPKNRMVWIFTLLTFCAACWQLDGAVKRIVVSAQVADTWDCIFCASWAFIGPLCLHFSLLYSGTMKKVQSMTVFILLYLPAFIFMGLYGSHVYPHVFRYSHFWGWVNSHNQNPVDIALVCWIAVSVFAATLLLFNHAWRMRNETLLRYPSLFIAVGIAIPVFTGITLQVIFPVVLRRPAIPMPATFIAIFSFITVLVLTRYRLFRASELIGSEELIEALRVMILSISTQKRITYMNTYGAELLGIKKSAVSHKSVNELFWHESVESTEEFAGAWNRAIRGEGTEMLELQLRTPGGRADMMVSLMPMVNNGLVHGVLFTGRDITELKRSYRLISDNELLLREAQRLSHIGSWKWDIRANLVSWSDELFRIYGYIPGEIAVKFETFLQAMIPEDRPKASEVIQQALISHLPFTFFYHVKKKDGTMAILRSRGRVTVGENNEPIQMDGTCQDVTESWNREKMLEKQNLELKKINQELDRFVYSASHDLRGPLASVMGIVNVAEMETSDPLVHNYLSLIRKSMARLDKFILDILDYSRNARAGVKNETVDFNELLREVTEDVRFVNGAPHKVDIRISVHQEAPFRSDRMRLGIILRNLLANAIHYHHTGAASPYVSIAVIVSGNSAEIAVSDNGIGIREEHQDKVFEMFYRGSEKSRGSGLGLYIVRETVQKLGGSILLESTPGKGSIFRIHLPGPAVEPL